MDGAPSQLKLCAGTFPPLAGVCRQCLRFDDAPPAERRVEPAPDRFGGCDLFLDPDPSLWLPW
jgi:hypothetical protein